MEKNETFDLVDEKGNVTGSASREECHSNTELLHPVVHFTLFNPSTNEVLLTQRSFTKRWDPGKNVFFGEHVISGESYEDGLKRGVEEEIGFKPEKYRLLGDTVFHEESQTEYARFFLVYYNNQEIDFEKEEIERIYWIKTEELKDFNDNLGKITKYWIENIDWSTLE
jgi:isopentenyldiphosphate isomerase